MGEQYKITTLELLKGFLFSSMILIGTVGISLSILVVTVWLLEGLRFIAEKL